MEIGLAKRVRSLVIRTLRESDGTVARTVFCVMEPQTFSKVNYVVTEHCGRVEPFCILLYLPYVIGTLHNLPSERRREGLLGSDFSYDDMRTWLYEECHQYGKLDDTGSLVRVRGVCTEKIHLVRHGSAPFDVWMENSNAFIRGIDYFSSDGSTVIREYRADEVRTIDGVAVAGQMTMFDRLRNHSTTIRLERAWYDRPIDTGVFDPSFRKHTWDYLSTL